MDTRVPRHTTTFWYDESDVKTEGADVIWLSFALSKQVWVSYELS
jgi:hypothetical protein